MYSSMRSIKYLSLLACSAILIFLSCNNNATDETKSTTTGTQKMQVTTEPGTIEKTIIAFQDTLIDFGRKPQGEIIHLKYKFKNAGDKPLIISDVQSSCGCTIAGFPKEPVPPGGEGEISAEFDTNKTDRGSVQKMITVYANDVARNQFYLSFQGTVTEPQY